MELLPLRRAGVKVYGIFLVGHIYQFQVDLWVEAEKKKWDSGEKFLPYKMESKFYKIIDFNFP